MAKTIRSLASAVVLPEPSSPSPAPPSPQQRQRQRQPQPGTKRTQQSSDPDPRDPATSPKRQRTCPPPRENASSRDHNPPSKPSPSRATRPVDETRDKRRNQRLFGALLGGLGGGSAAPRAPRDSAAAKRRQEAEERRREEAMRREAELGARQQERLDKLVAERKIQQRGVDATNLRIRHANLRARAGFLVTETEPRVYYEPWKLLPEDEEKIKQQKDEVEVLIDRELDDFADLKKKWREAEEEQEQEQEKRGDGRRQRRRRDTLDTATMDKADVGRAHVDVAKGAKDETNNGVKRTDETTEDKAETAVGQPAEKAAAEATSLEEARVEEEATSKESGGQEEGLDTQEDQAPPLPQEASEQQEALHERERKSSIDDTGDVVVEGEEDTVIY